MDGQLKLGCILTSVSGNKYTVQKLLGAGSQGEVYSVTSGNQKFALKWYFKHMATPSQLSILENLITKPAPDEAFLWPLDLVILAPNQFGYIMDLRPSEFKGIVDMMKRKADPSFYTLCKIAFNMTKGYKKLHETGYCYFDINFGNAFFNPDTGDVLICDNDNVSVNGSNESSVYGTPRFMAPEIVVGKAKPSRNTDLYSLAVLLFYMFMLNHPLEGRLEANIKCMDIFAMNKLFGTDPVFIYDPDNKTNRPVRGYHDNAIIFWDLYPQKLREQFTHSFTVGLSSPARRITENKWMETFANMMGQIVKCPHCGAEVFLDERKEETGVAHTCWNCQGVVQIPVSIMIEKYRVLITSDTKLYRHHLYNDGDMETVVGSISVNPKNPQLWGIKNETDGVWTYIKADGSHVPIAPGRSAAIVKGAQIHLGTSIAEFK